MNNLMTGLMSRAFAYFVNLRLAVPDIWSIRMLLYDAALVNADLNSRDMSVCSPSVTISKT